MHSFSESGRKSGRGLRASKIRADMISGPQNDLRHTGHIGMDGATFGDVAFIGNNYDKLPLKVVTPCMFVLLVFIYYMFNPLTAKLLNWNFHPLEIVSR